ncbi:hypothetical protein Hs20B_08290 [Lactococcus insecticola]|uniref:Uncharacterized protein n=2 Tax=Pseudolactococcus insecticola TaxID=2709158 RepID=A0A6A0B7G2_9LACT|nr:hypothetical protein Hs20B_08290 [Lactococcus insecticola]
MTLTSDKVALTDFDNNFLSDFAYYVDKKMALHDKFAPISAGDSFSVFINGNRLDKCFQVIKTIDDTATGLQAMAVKASSSQIVIAYAGTNPLDKRDVLTDVTTIVVKKNLPRRDNPQQHLKALAFFKVIKAENPTCNITLTGHSLGGFLALYVACLTARTATVFNAPDPAQLLSDIPQTRDIRNFRHRKDSMGNFAGNGTGAEILSDPWLFSARTPFVYHGVAMWKFDKNGNIER